jgi:hypothetical protein
MIGPGKYDAECTAAQKATNAAGVILIVVGGDKGPGFSCQATLEVTRILPDMLRQIANQLEIDLTFNVGQIAS